MKNFTLLWAIWVGAFLVFEAVALLTRKPGDTLSENVWAIFRPYALTRAFIGALLGWLVWHFLFYAGQGYGIEDAIAIVLGAVAGFVGGRFRRATPAPQELPK